MSEIHVSRIEKKLEEIYKDKIDMSDIENKSDDNKWKSFLSRSQAALVISHFAEVTYDQSINSITDGYQDNGIDAIYIDDNFKQLCVVQSKWTEKGSKSPEFGDLLKFLKGFKDLINGRFSLFNNKIKKKEEQILKAISSTDYKFTIIIAYTSNQPISAEFKSELDALLDQFNDTSEVLSYEVYDQKRIYKAILVGSEGEPINLESVSLYNYGKHESPYVSYYGEVDLNTINEWYANYGTRLYAKNIRLFKGITEVNDGIKKTIMESPEDFWYFNNGITILCNRIKKGALHATDTKVGLFDFFGISVVNGAQTIGSIGSAFIQTTKEIKNAKVQVRFINLEETPKGYAQKITKYNNTQNKIESRDFIALDPNQERIQQELWLSNVSYTYKSGDKPKLGVEGCDVEEATIALACAHSDIIYSVQSKNEIGNLWSDINKPPYRHIFNTATTGLKVWRCVQVLRAVEKKLTMKRVRLPEDKGVLTIHANRLILYKVFRCINVNLFDKQSLDFEFTISESEKYTDAIFDIIMNLLEQDFKEVHFYNFFKRKVNCERVSNEIDKILNIGQLSIDFK